MLNFDEPAKVSDRIMIHYIIQSTIMRPFLYIPKVAPKLFSSKLTNTIFEHNTFLVFGVITLFLLGVYFLLVGIFLHSSLGLSVEGSYTKNKKINIITIYENNRQVIVFSLKGIDDIYNLSSISNFDHLKTINSDASLDINMKNELLSSSFAFNYKQNPGQMNPLDLAFINGAFYGVD